MAVPVKALLHQTRPTAGRNHLLLQRACVTPKDLPSSCVPLPWGPDRGSAQLLADRWLELAGAQTVGSLAVRASLRRSPLSRLM